MANLLDHIEDNHGTRLADLVLAYVSGIANWFSARDDAYVSPMVRGMRRHSKGGRERILTDAELRSLWRAAEGAGAFGALVRLLLLTGQRLTKVATIQRDDLDANNTWHIHSEPREKTNAGDLPLPDIAVEIIRSQPRVAGNPYVFAGRADRARYPHYGKSALNQSSGVTGWTLHDLRRTARSLMSRAGVSSEHAERVLGHTIKGVEGVYDRHRYEAEKGRALAALAQLIGNILAGNADVVPFRREA